MLHIDDIKHFHTLKNWQKRIVWGTVEHEKEFRRALPNNSYFKGLSLKILRKEGVSFSLI